MTVLQHVDFETAERDAYLRMAAQIRRSSGEGDEEEYVVSEGDDTAMTPDNFQRLQDAEEFILTITENGFGKRTSAYEYRVTGRGGQGFANIEMKERNGAVVASFPIGTDDQIMLISDGGQLIRMPVHDVRIAGRKTQGVTLFRTAAEEKVVSVARLPDVGEGNGDGTQDQQDSDGIASLPDEG